MKMCKSILLLFLCIVMYVSAVEYNPILFKISSGTSVCNKENLFHNFDLSEVSQFGALCNIPIPNVSQVEFLLENNVVPILCMGLYDVSLRVCKSALDDITPFADMFPPTTEKFSKIFTTLDESNEFSSLGTFCSTTAKSYAINESAVNLTKLWWSVLNQQFMDINKCMSICRTYENNKVQPLCSYITWSNGIYLNHQKSQAESQEPTAVSGDQINSFLEEKLDELKKVGEKATPSAVENQPFSLLTVQPMKSAIPTLLIKNSSVAQVEVMSTEPNSTAKLAATSSGNSKQPIIPQKPIAVEDTVKSEQEKSLVLNSNNTETNFSLNSGFKPTNVDKVIKKKKHSKNKLPVVEVTPSPPEVNIEEIPKAGPGSSAPVVTKPDTVDQTKPSSDRAAAAMVEGDFSFEMTPEGVGLDQPIAADKDPQLHQPYSDEEVEDGDGDDVDMEPESPVKIVPNKTDGSSLPNKPSSSSIGQGVAEPDKAYSDERRILMEDHFIDAEESHFFTYFLCVAVLTIMAYLAFHNKKKLVALAVEGRRTRGSRRRPNCSNYSKLDCSLEEAMTSKTTASVTHVLY